MPDNTRKPDYRGLRALLLTRVSTSEQEKMYGHSWQESQIRQKLIEPLGLQLDEKHIIRDTYSGLEYRYREALDIILAMAEHNEFDVLCMEVLDRGLGRKALAREVFRMQLRELGIRILTTDPHDHADDDTLEGQLMRFIKGYKAEEEINDLVRRSKGGKLAKATGDERMGVPARVVGNGHRTYGYKFILDERGKRIGVELNYDVVHIEADGTQWTEVSVVVFIFESAAKGMTVRSIAQTLNMKGIPSPYATMGIKNKRAKKPPIWQPSEISQKLRQSEYWGERREFKTRSIGRVPGKQHFRKQKTLDAEQVIIPVPAIVTKELAEAAQNRAQQNKNGAARNNHNPQDTLMRAGPAKCGHCGCNLSVHRDRRRKTVSIAVGYTCPNHNMSFGMCEGCHISVTLVDTAAWEEAVKTIRDPSEVDAKVQKLLKEVSAAKYRKQTTSELTEIRKRQASLRKDFSDLSQEGKLDKGTREFLSGQLQILAKQEEDAKKHVADERAMQEKYNLVEQKLLAFHKRCQEWREKLNDPEFNPPYEFKREAIEFFGITAKVYRSGYKPRCVIETDPPSIMSILSSVTS